tara:strand:- start:1041 stop:2390 length:1350 start_codon:yes stop_codon:yes gene_type:complete
MSHAVFIKQKSISSFLLNELPSFEFNVQYVPVVLISKNSRGHFEWTRGNSSSIENTKGSLGTTVPTNMYLTPLLHRYSNFGHTHEMIIEHEYPNTIGNRKVYFVFFLQLKKDGLMKTPLDSFLDKDTPQMDVQSFVQTSLNNNSSQKIYYQTNKRDNVFIFPNAITVHSSKLQELTATPKPPTQVYNEVFLNDGLRESNRIPMENTKEIVVSPLSYDITVKINTNVVVEGFVNLKGKKVKSYLKNLNNVIGGNNQPQPQTIPELDQWHISHHSTTPQLLDCYPEGTDEHDYTVNIKMAEDKIVFDIHNMFPIFVLVFLIIIIFAPLTGVMLSLIVKEKWEDGPYRLLFALFTFICFAIFMSFGISASHVNPKMAQKFNMVFIVFFAIYCTILGVSTFLIYGRVKIGSDLDFSDVDDHPLPKFFGFGLYIFSFFFPVLLKVPQKDPVVSA